MRHVLSDVRVEGFASLPKSSAWEIKAFGRTRHRPLTGEHETEIIFREFQPTGQKGVLARAVRRVPDSQLMSAEINSLWHGGFRQPDYREHRDFTIRVKQPMKGLFRLERAISEDALKECGISDDIIKILAQSRWVLYGIEKTKELSTTAVLFPCAEIVRRFACHESGFATAFMTGRFLSDPNLDTRLTRKNGVTTVKMPMYLRDDVAKYLAHYIRSRPLRELNSYVLFNLTLDNVSDPAQDGGGSPMAAFLPLQLPVTMNVTGSTVSTKNGRRVFLVDRIVSVNAPLLEEDVLHVDRESPPPIIRGSRPDAPPPPPGTPRSGHAPDPDNPKDEQVDDLALDEDGRTNKPISTALIKAENPLFSGTEAIMQEKAYTHREVQRQGCNADEGPKEPTKYGTGPASGRHGHKHPASLIESSDDVARRPHNFEYLRGVIGELRTTHGVEIEYVAAVDNWVLGEEGPINFFPTHIHGHTWSWSRIRIDKDNVRARQCAIVRVRKYGHTAYLYDIEKTSDTDSYQIRGYMMNDYGEMPRDMSALILQWLMLAKGREITKETSTGERKIYKTVQAEGTDAETSLFARLKETLLGAVIQQGFVHEREKRYATVARKIEAFLKDPHTPSSTARIASATASAA